MDEIDARDSKLNRQPQNSSDAAPNNGERVRCRNLRCRCKLGAPTDNHHKAFCSQYCYDQFYRWKCVVCEKELPREGRRRTLCRGHSSVGSIIASSPRPIRYLIALSYPGGQNVNLTQKVPAKQTLFSASEPVRGGVGRRVQTSTDYSSAMTMW
jgi:hypothetical protein